uniref:Ankyrin repeat, SAM and basic leucine zipper domain containing 1 n=1 Tax=Takifugu rubripes TaxID=31033 RepID=H2V3Y3_TAKRU
MDNAYPAGEESDFSDDEWDIGTSYEKTPRVQDLDAVASGEGDVVTLKRAITNGDIETVTQLLDKGLDVETRLNFEWTPLMCAVNVANYNLSKLLLDRGANASFHKDHWTVLMACITASAKEDRIARCVELLLSRNADPNMVDRSRMSCLMFAAKSGYSKVINLLMSYGAEINAQDDYGYTALSIAVQHGRQEAVLKLLQLGADKTLTTKTGKSPADLAIIIKNPQMGKILASSPHVWMSQASDSMEDALSQLFMTNSEAPSAKECVKKLDEIQLLLHGLDLGYLTDIMTIGVTDPGDQQKVMNALQQMTLDKVDLNTIDQFGAADSGSEEFYNFLISVRQQCCYLTETIQDVMSRFPCHPSQIVFSLDPKKEAQAICNQLVIQTEDLQKEVICLHKLLCQLDDTEESCQPPPPESRSYWRMRFLSRAALSVLGATCFLVVYGATSGLCGHPSPGLLLKSGDRYNCYRCLERRLSCSAPKMS